MNSLYTRCGAALLCASTLAACGGGDDGAFPLSGTINGLNREGLILSNKGKQLTVVYANTPTSFTFPDTIATDAEFEVLVAQSPAGQTCVPTNNKSKANYYTYNQTVINCTTEPFVLGGSISGLTANGLVLVNGSATVSPVANATSFTFGKTVFNGLPYGVTVLSQPAGLTCTVLNGTSINKPESKMPMADVNDIVVNCVPKEG